MLMIEFTQDKVDLLNNFSQGQSVKVAINLRGREWINPAGKAKYFNSLQGWKIEQA
jgi:translation initiation factor IF-3